MLFRSTNTTVSSITGAAVVVGGIATQANLYVAGASWHNNLSVFSSNTTTTSATGAAVVTGGVGIGGNIYVANSGWLGNLNILNTTVSTTTTTGALVVAGGVGIGGAVYTGSTISAAGEITAYSSDRRLDRKSTRLNSSHT